MAGVQYTNGAIEFIQTEEGVARRNGTDYSYEYNLTDHLGNVRATFYKNPNGQLAEVIQRDDYFAFGLRKMGTPNSNVNKYLYNGKELQEELGQYDYGARFYDPVIGRWNVVDPKAELYFSHSPYNYVAGNPILLVDPNGMEIISIAGGVRFTEEDAKSAFEVITGQKRNVYININDSYTERQEINADDKKKSYGSWAVFSAKNFGLANEALGAFGDRSLSNLAIETHGGRSDGEAYMRTDDGEPTSSRSNIFTSEINDFLDGSMKRSEVALLQSMASKVSDGGRLIIAPCLGGAGAPGEQFGAAINKLTGNRLNVFLPKDFVTSVFKRYSTGLGLSLQDNFKVTNNAGWLQTLPNGQTRNIKDIKLSPYFSAPVNIVK